MSSREALDRFFASYYQRRPVTATFTGVHDHDHRLPDWSPEGLAAAVAEMQARRRDLEAAGRVPDDEVRGFPVEVDLALADAFLEIQIAEHGNGHFYQSNPALWTGEAIFSVIALVTRPFAPLDARLEAARARMMAIPAFLADARTTLQAAPARWRDRALRECDAAQILFGRSLPSWLLQDAPRSTDVLAACEVARVAFATFQRWLEADLPAADTDRESAGADFLSLLLSRGHWHRTAISTLRSEAEAALDQAHGLLDSRVREAGARSWADAQTRLGELRPSADDYLSSFADTWNRCRDAVVAADLVSWPDRPLRYVPIPAHTRDAAPLLYYLFYRSPAAFDRLPVHDYVVTPIDEVPPDELDRRLRAASFSAILLNHVVHHGGLGHHVQNAWACDSASRIGQVAAIDAASRIAMFSGGSLAEGWACYACDLAEEIGLLTPLERAAQQQTRVRLAARAVADLALHAGDISVEGCTRFYETRGLMPAAAAQAEAVKTSMFPGAAVMYWLGTRDIHRLRGTVRDRQAERFSLKNFHDALLGYGAIPTALIARLMAPEVESR